MKETGRSFDWSNLILGIIFILGALFSFANPTSSLVGLATVIGVVAIIKGIFEIFLRRRLRQLTGASSTALIVLGVIDIILGILIMTNMTASVIALPILFAIWFILDAVANLIFAAPAKMISQSYYWFKIILNVLGVIVGIMLLTNITSSALTLSFLIGFSLMAFGIMNVVEAFSR